MANFLIPPASLSRKRMIKAQAWNFYRSENKAAVTKKFYSLDELQVSGLDAKKKIFRYTFRSFYKVVYTDAASLNVLLLHDRSPNRAVMGPSTDLVEFVTRMPWCGEHGGETLRKPFTMVYPFTCRNNDDGSLSTWNFKCVRVWFPDRGYSVTVRLPYHEVINVMCPPFVVSTVSHDSESNMAGEFII